MNVNKNPVEGSGTEAVVADRQEFARTRELAEVFRSLQSLLLTVDDLESFLQRLAELAPGLLDADSVACGITVRRDGKPYTVASSDDRASALDESQYAAEQGPCLHSLRSGEIVWLPDLDHEHRWTDYLRQARSEGLEWSLSLPLPAEGDQQPLGALNIYGFTGSAVPDSGQRHRFELFAAQAAGAMQLATHTIRAAQNRRELESALRSRTVIDQAIGILMAQQRCTAEEAFALLRTHSQHNNTKLREVAAGLIQRVTGQPPQPGTPFIDN